MGGMGKETGISWTEHTFNPWWGCTKVSPGCDNCYAETLDKRWGEPHWGKGVPRRVMSDAYWREPLKWNAMAEGRGVQETVFCASMADVMDDEAPEGQRERLWRLIEQTPYLIWQLLTKRPQRYAKNVPKLYCPQNIWLGTSAEDQANYDLRWPHLFQAALVRNLVTFISYEPALGPLTMCRYASFPRWLICGGESGPGRRPMQEEWARNIKAECKEAGTKFWMKQMSARTPKQGAELIPAELLIREFPTRASHEA
jgi:protein gp37